MMIRVLLCEREPLVRVGLRAVVSAEPGMAVVGEFSDGPTAASAMAELEPNVIVADTLALTGAAGCASGELVDASLSAGVPVLVLADRGCLDGAAAALRAGARGFLLKDDPPTQITYGIREVAAGNALLSPTVTARLLSDLTPAERPGPVRSEVDLRSVLTAREVQVLSLLAGGMTVGGIARRLVVAEVTVRSHIHHMLRKLELDRAFQAVALAHASGLLNSR
ncbi:response regulator [Nocardia sp. SYP-A9097]|uniref:LuxR C-terminal-related transcriptional regulator n=1 Tax=Nocardia sp. SYP-A9097 TaxID=2663237 RepID=UPI00129A2A58|nr:response regulator transcription factor [Nocardia sp. SYP-A9097]MRH88020.1 response regulator [Nocardia sp. SYP-A9097]